MYIKPVKEKKFEQKRYCHFCVSQIDGIDYKDINILRRYISSYGKIVPPRRSGACSGHQRKLAAAIKRARVMALLPITVK